MPEQDALAQRDIHYLAKGLDELKTTLTAMDSKWDTEWRNMRETYLTAAEFGRWKKETFAPFQDETTNTLEHYDTRINRWLWGLSGAVTSGLIMLVVYLIVSLTTAHTGSVLKP